MTKTQVLNFATADVCELLENIISQPMYTAQSGKLAWPEQKDEQRQQVIFFQSAASYIAHRVTEGFSLNKAQNEWLSLASIINDQHRNNRRKVRLVDADFMLRDNSEFQKFLGEHGIAFSDSMLKSGDLIFPTLEYIAARHRVLAFEELRELDTTLRAASLPATDEDGPVNIELAIQQFKEQHDQQIVLARETEGRLDLLTQKYQQELSETQNLLKQQQVEFEAEHEEKELLLLQIKQVQEELETSFSQAKALETKYQGEISHREKAESDLSALKQQQVEFEAEHEEKELLLLQLKQVQEELETSFSQAKALEVKYQGEVNQREKAERELSALKQHQSQLEAQLEGKELLMLQLKQAQEELAASHLRSKELERITQESLSAQEKREGELKSQLGRAKSELEKITEEAKKYKDTLDAQVHEQALVELQEENELLLLQVQQLQEELEKYYLRAKELEELSLNTKGSNDELNALHLKLKKFEKIISENNKKLNSLTQKNRALKLDNGNLKVEVQELESRNLFSRVGAPNLPAVIPQTKATKHRIPSRFLKLVKRPFVGKAESEVQNELKRQKQLIINSGLFDEKFYLENYPDVTLSSLEPVEHYLKFGGFEGRKPSEKFDSTFYLLRYKDVRDENVNPLVHYVQYGVHEKRLTRKRK